MLHDIAIEMQPSVHALIKFVVMMATSWNVIYNLSLLYCLYKVLNLLHATIDLLNPRIEENIFVCSHT